MEGGWHYWTSELADKSVKSVNDSIKGAANGLKDVDDNIKKSVKEYAKNFAQGVKEGKSSTEKSKNAEKPSD